MHKLEKYLEEYLEYVEDKMERKPPQVSTHMEKDYIDCCVKQCLNVLALLAAKRAYDKHMPHDDHMPIAHATSPVNL